MNYLSYIQQTWDFSFSTLTLIMSLFLNHHHSWGNTVKAVLSASSDVTSYAEVLLHFWFSSADSTRTLSPSTPWSTSKWRNREPSVSRFQVAIRTLSSYSHLDSHFAHCHDSYSKGGPKVHLWYCRDPIWGIGVNLKRPRVRTTLKRYCISLYGVKLWIGLSDELKQGGGGALTRRSHPLFTHCVCVSV